MKLNLGSGWRPVEGFTNVDLHYAADVRADLRTVSFPAGTIEVITCFHTIEHLREADGRSLIRRCFEWLQPGGWLLIETPDREKCRTLIKKGQRLQGAKGLWGGRSIRKKEWHDWLTLWLDDPGIEPPEWSNLPGEAHLHVWTAAELSQAFREAGFIDVVTQAPSSHGGRVWRDSAVFGRKDWAK